MTGAEFAAARRESRLSYRRLADALGVSVGALRHWETLDHVPEHVAREVLAIACTPEQLTEIAEAIGRLTAVCEHVLGRTVRPALRQTLASKPLHGIALLMRQVMAQPASRREPYSRRISAIMGRIPPTLPDVNTLAQQTAYELGYWHERDADEVCDAE